MNEQIPTDLQPVPEDLQPDVNLDVTKGPLAWLQDPALLRQGLQGLRQMHKESDQREPLGNKFAPSLPTALSVLVPGSGLAGAAMRTGAVAGAKAGESALSGEGSPGMEALKGGATQAVAEGAIPAAKLVGQGVKLFARPWTNPARIENMLYRMSQPPAPVPGEYMGKYGPTGIPASKILGPTGQPARPAIEPQVVPHKDLRGWTLLDVLNQSTQKAATKIDPLQILMRLIGAGGQEAIERNE